MAGSPPYLGCANLPSPILTLPLLARHDILAPLCRSPSLASSPSIRARQSGRPAPMAGGAWPTCLPCTSLKSWTAGRRQASARGNG